MPGTRPAHVAVLGSGRGASRNPGSPGEVGRGTRPSTWHADNVLVEGWLVQTRRVTERVSISRSGGVADVRLNRADKLNALDPPMFTALVRAADEVADDRSVRAVVLSGEGRGFCAGLDLTSVQAIAGGDVGGGDDEEAKSGQAMSEAARSLTDRMPGRITNLFQEVAHAWTALEVPVIAACTGPVLGGGLQIALGADIRFTTPDAKWSVLEIRWGLLPDMTGIQNLVRLVGLDVAKELTYTAAS